MKNKTLPILLVLPFAIGILSIITIKFVVNIVSEDIVDIAWDYRQNEGFEVNAQFELKAEPLGSQNALKDPLNELTWKINEHLGDDLATISKSGSSFYLSTHDIGEIMLTCQNVRGTVARSFKAHIYQTGIILINPRYDSSLGVEDTPYIGQYDFTTTGQKNANYPLDVQLLPSTLDARLSVNAISPGVTYQDNTLIINSVSAKVEVKAITFITTNPEINAQSFNFKVVKDGYNVYTYNELLRATNSENPKIVVQQKHFESLENTYDSRGNLLREDTTLFGTYDFGTKDFNFANEVYRFKTTAPTKYIEDWNKRNQAKLSDEIIVGLHVQKDYYGNGFKLNGHNLTFPYETTTNSEGVKIATLNAKNLFRGPLPFVALGNPTDLSLIKIYGQDNIFFYVDNDNVTVRDVNIRNADFGNNLNNLNYTGTAIEVNGNDVTIINSQIKNAKTAVRVASSENTILKNSYLATTRQFLLAIGTTEYEEANQDATKLIYDVFGNLVNNQRTKFSDYFKYPQKPLGLNDIENIDTSTADGLVTAYLMAKGPNQILINAIKNLDAFLNQDDLVRGLNDRPIFKTHVSVEDTMFYQSGVASIALETLFNGPFLYESLPSIITSTLESLLAGVRPDKVGAISYPAELKLKGATEFYDYKNTKNIDVGAIIEENISTIMNESGLGSSTLYTADDVFPIRKLLENSALNKGYVVTEREEDTTNHFINIPIIYYGGGVNLSTIDTNELYEKENFSDKIELDLLMSLLSNTAEDSLTLLMQRSVLTATGFKPFFYHTYKTPYLYGMYPTIETLKNRANEEA